MRGGMNPVRPTSSKLLQTFFNIIGPAQDGAFLDLFSGTGRVAFEAVKKGFDCVIAVEIERKACSSIRSQAEKTPDGLALEILCMDVRRAMVSLARKSRKFSVIFADPPYENGWVRELLRGDAFLWIPLLEEEGVFVLEHSIREKIPENLVGLTVRTRQYGDSCLSFFSLAGRESESA